MSQLLSELSYTYPTGAHASWGSDIVQENQENIGESQTGYYTAWRPCDFPELVLPPILDTAAFEDAFSIDPTPMIPDERNPNDSQTCFVTFLSFQKNNRVFGYLQPENVISLYGRELHRIGLPSPRSRFHPDFYKIKNVVAHIMGQYFGTSAEQHFRLPRIRENITSVPTAEVISEAKKRGITDSLKTTVQLIQESYSTILKSINVSVEHDPEISDRKTIRFTLTVSGKAEVILENEASFKRDLYSQVDASARELITITYKLEK